MNAPAAVKLDSRLAFLCVCHSHYRLIEDGHESVDHGFRCVTTLFDHMFPPDAPCCPTCGMAPCGNPSFCAESRRADYKRGRR